MSSFSEWLSKPAGVLTTIIGLIAAVTGFVLGVQTNAHLTIVVSIGVATAATVIALTFIVLAKEHDLIGDPIERFSPRARSWAGIAIALTMIAVLYVIVHPTSRAWIVDSPAVTLITHTVGPTEPTRTQGSALPPSVRRTIIIAEYDSPLGSPAVSLRHQINDALIQRLRDQHVEGIRVEMDSLVVRKPEEARKLAQDNGAAAVIYGYADARNIGTSVFINERPRTLTPIDAEHATWESLPVTGTLSVLGTTAIEQATFLALFVTGELLYLDNRYAEGARALDEAARQRPSALQLRESAMLYFIRARAAQQGLPILNTEYNQQHNEDELATIACDYAKAIQLDRRMYHAYNNLGILVARDVVLNRVSSGHGRDTSINPKIRACLVRTGLEVKRADDLFAQAARLQPKLAAIEYNRLATRWAASNEQGSLDGFDQAAFTRELERLLQSDSSIAGAHVMLGIIAFDRNDLPKAEAELRLAVEQRPGMIGLNADLGQVYLRESKLDLAREAFAKELAAHPDDMNALTSAAVVAIKSNDDMTALRYLEARQTSRDPSVVLLRADIYARRGDLDRAITVCKEEIKDEKDTGGELLPLMFAAAYEYRAGRITEAIACVRRINDLAPLMNDEWLWRDVAHACPPTRDAVKWLTGTCLHGAIEGVFQTIFASVSAQIHHRNFVFADLG